MICIVTRPHVSKKKNKYIKKNIQIVGIHLDVFQHIKLSRITWMPNQIWIWKLTTKTSSFIYILWAVRQFLPIKVQKLQILYNKSLLFVLMQGYNITFTWIALLKITHTTATCFIIVAVMVQCQLDRIHFFGKTGKLLIKWYSYPVKCCRQGQQGGRHGVLLWAGAVLRVKQQGTSERRAGHSGNHVKRLRQHLFSLKRESPAERSPSIG